MTTTPTLPTMSYRAYKDVPAIRGDTQIDLATAQAILVAAGLQSNPSSSDNFDSPFFMGSNNSTLLRDVVILVKNLNKPLNFSLNASAKTSDWHVIPTEKAVLHVTGADVYVVHHKDQEIKILNQNPGSNPLRVHVGSPNIQGTGFNLHGTFVIPAGSSKMIGA